MRKLLAETDNELQITIDSAGTHAYHVGERPDPRSIEAASARGIDLSDQRARAVEISDFNNFDLILAMDHDNLELLERMQPENSTASVRLFLSYNDTSPNEPVPDPYYGGPNGFERVLDLLEETSRHLLTELRQR